VPAGPALARPPAAPLPLPPLGWWCCLAPCFSCSSRIRSSTTVEATGSSPAVGSSYMMTWRPRAAQRRASSTALCSTGGAACPPHLCPPTPTHRTAQPPHLLHAVVLLVAHNGACQGHPLLHAPRQLAGVQPFHAAQPHLAQRLSHQHLGDGAGWGGGGSLAQSDRAQRLNRRAGAAARPALASAVTARRRDAASRPHPPLSCWAAGWCARAGGTPRSRPRSASRTARRSAHKGC
jgi:hypothetical protein